MTYLELVQQTLAQTGSGSEDQIDSLVDLDGYEGLIKSYVRQAWLKMQEGQDWQFARLRFECVLQAGQREYTPEGMRDQAGFPSIPNYRNATESATNVRKWLRRSRDGEQAWVMTDLGTPGPEGPRYYGARITIDDYSYFHRRYLTIPESSVTRRRPERMSLRDDRQPLSIIVFPTPNVSDRYILYGECHREAQQLELDADQPYGLPVEYHEAIKWRAIMLANAYDENGDAYQFAKAAFTEIYSDTTSDLTPEWRVGDALA